MLVAPQDAIRDYFRDDPSRMTMMAARKFGVAERDVVDALVGQWPIRRLRAGCFRALMDELPVLGTMRVFVRSRAAVASSWVTHIPASPKAPRFLVG